MKKFSKKILMLLMAIVVLVTPTFTGAVRQEVHNDRNYNWYIDQGNTGWASNSNCGPSSSVMVEKWFHILQIFIQIPSLHINTHGALH